MNRRRALLATSTASVEENIFPIHLNLKKISNEEYRCDPTPESMAFCDYFIANAVFDGMAAYWLFLNPGDLYIDDIEVQTVSAIGGRNGIITLDSSWWPYHERYDDFFTGKFEIYWEDSEPFTKGTFRVYDDE